MSMEGEYQRGWLAAIIVLRHVVDELALWATSGCGEILDVTTSTDAT